MMAGGVGGAKMQRAHYNTASDRALAAPPPPKTQQSNYVSTPSPSPLNITITYRRRPDTKGTGEVSEGCM